MDNKKHAITIAVVTAYIAEQSDSNVARYVFSYNITITNTGSVAAQLLRRRWLITDANSKTQKVYGDGVVGEQPHLKPGESFNYSSGAVIETPVGSMQGSYEMQADDGVAFAAPIAPFTLAVPNTLH